MPATAPRRNLSPAPAASGAAQIIPLAGVVRAASTFTGTLSFRRSRERKRPRRLLEELRGPWLVRRPVKRTGAPRFVMTEDLPALAMMRCAFAHAATWPVMWAIFWRQQTQHPFDPDMPADISIEEIVAQTGYARSTVYLALGELTDRDMLVILSGGGRRRKSAYGLTDLERWML